MIDEQTQKALITKRKLDANISTETLLQIYRFASAIEPYLAGNKGDMPDYLLDECCSIISELTTLIVARTKED